jgi:murein L,D-transpeptidase YcbB/YkuD
MPGWTPDSVRAAARLPWERRVAVPDTIAAYLVYWTAWVERDGTVQFRPDLYGWDAELADALSRRAREVP